MELGIAWKARSNNRRSSNLLQKKNPCCLGEGETTMVATSKQTSMHTERERERAQALFFSVFLWLVVVDVYVC